VQVFDGLDQMVASSTFENISFGTCGKRFENVFIIFIGGAHHDGQFRIFFLQKAGALDTVHSRQIDIHQNDIKVFLRYFLGGYFGVFKDLAGKTRSAIDDI
jgi:hypothetical protein